MGSSMMKEAPWPRRDWTTIRPPCSRMIFCETGRPSPVPREPLVEAKIWKIEAMSASSMPDAVVGDDDPGRRRRRRPTRSRTSTWASGDALGWRRWRW